MNQYKQNAPHMTLPTAHRERSDNPNRGVATRRVYGNFRKEAMPTRVSPEPSHSGRAAPITDHRPLPQSQVDEAPNPCETPSQGRRQTPRACDWCKEDDDILTEIASTTPRVGGKRQAFNWKVIQPAFLTSKRADGTPVAQRSYKAIQLREKQLRDPD